MDLSATENVLLEVTMPNTYTNIHKITHKTEGFFLFCKTTAQRRRPNVDMCYLAKMCIYSTAK